ncbi:hypothetical protein [Amycolatopsis sp. NPDC059657]|uniref:hypothetical protein n=1 Tax=Amycolatopsis sp. NPDC059657 TaxID=3346899 RepID=UPI003671EE44
MIRRMLTVAALAAGLAFVGAASAQADPRGCEHSNYCQLGSSLGVHGVVGDVADDLSSALCFVLDDVLGWLHG